MISSLPPYHTLLLETGRIVQQARQELPARLLAEAPGFTPFYFMKWGEVPLTHMLAYFLDPDQAHGQRTVFQESFLDKLQGLLPRAIPRETYAVIPEKRHGGGAFGQIDLLLTAPSHRYAICIENKPRVNTADQEHQLENYQRYLTGVGGFGENYLLIYLSAVARSPQEWSISPVERIKLEQSGHYLNLTYQDFFLPLISQWAELAKPEKVRAFLLDFRYQIERQLNFPSTAPTAKMNQDEIADLLLKDVTLLEAAYELPNALTVAERRLQEKLLATVRTVAAQLGLHLVSTPEELLGFQRFEGEAPCKLIKPGWGSYSIGLEFESPMLDVGVTGGNKNSHVAAHMAQKLGDAFGNDNWAYWDHLYTDFKLLYLDLAGGAFETKLQSRLTQLAEELDFLARENKLS